MRRSEHWICFRYWRNWGFLGASLRVCVATSTLGPLGGILEAILSQLGPSAAILEAILKSLGPSFLEPSWANSLRRIPPKAKIFQKQCVFSMFSFTIKAGASMNVALLEPPMSPLGALLERSWDALERSWGRLGAILGLSLVSLGPS